jgi:hypothetical protein
MSETNAEEQPSPIVIDMTATKIYWLVHPEDNYLEHCLGLDLTYEQYVRLKNILEETDHYLWKDEIFWASKMYICLKNVAEETDS